MEKEEMYNVRWNRYQGHLVTAFESLLESSDLVDVTLGVEGKKFGAHKMLLSACSPYFRDLFKTNPCQHPIILLRDVPYTDLEALLQFMYNGEVSVMKGQLESFLKSGEFLKIQGLSHGEVSPDENTISNYKINSSQNKSNELNQSTNKRKRRLSKDIESSKTVEKSSNYISKRANSKPEIVDIIEDHVEENTTASKGYTGHLEENNVYIDEDRATGEGEDDLNDYDEGEDAYDRDIYVKEQEQEPTKPNKILEDRLSSHPSSLPPYNHPNMKYKQPNIKYYSEENTPANVNAYDLTTDKTTIPENHQVVNEIEDISAARVDLEEANADDFPLFYECPICERRFVHHDSFVAHKKFHSGLTVCSICTHPFSTIGTLNRHLRTVHKIPMRRHK